MVAQSSYGIFLFLIVVLVNVIIMIITTPLAPYHDKPWQAVATVTPVIPSGGGGGDGGGHK